MLLLKVLILLFPISWTSFRRVSDLQRRYHPGAMLTAYIIVNCRDILPYVLNERLLQALDFRVPQ